MQLADGQERADLKHFMHPGTPSASQLELADSAKFPEQNTRFDDLGAPFGGEGWWAEFFAFFASFFTVGKVLDPP